MYALGDVGDVTGGGNIGAAYTDFDQWQAQAIADGATIVPYPRHENFFTAFSGGIAATAPWWVDWFGRPCARYDLYAGVDDAVLARIHYSDNSGPSGSSGYEVPNKAAMVAWWDANLIQSAQAVGDQMGSALPSLSPLVWVVGGLVAVELLELMPRRVRE